MELETFWLDFDSLPFQASELRNVIQNYSGSRDTELTTEYHEPPHQMHIRGFWYTAYRPFTTTQINRMREDLERSVIRAPRAVEHEDRAVGPYRGANPQSEYRPRPSYQNGYSSPSSGPGGRPSASYNHQSFNGNQASGHSSQNFGNSRSSGDRHYSFTINEQSFDGNSAGDYSEQNFGNRAGGGNENNWQQFKNNKSSGNSRQNFGNSY